MKQHIKIPEDRVGALIGEEGKELERIEQQSDTEIEVTDNEAEIRGEALNVWKAREVVRAVGRGFSPVKALRLLEGAVLQVIDFGDLSDNRKRTVRSRLIGSGGRTRETIEEMTDTYISIYGKTAAVIGDEDNAAAAVHALKMLIDGSKHGTAYKYLEDWKEGI